MLERSRGVHPVLLEPCRRLRGDPLAPPAAVAAIVGTALILGAALVGATIRLLPWALDPTIGSRTLAPFAKSLAAVAFEAALMTGWPVGWALATQRLVERGEARVLASLGEPPVRTIARLVPQAVLLGVVLASSSMLLGRDAAAPGRVVNELLVEGRRACEPGTTRGIPFVAVTWLCPSRDDARPRLVGRAPMGNVVFTAEDAKVSDDLRQIELTTARLLLPTSSAKTTVRARVDRLVLRGMPPWARASSLPPLLRAVVVTGSSLVAGCAAVAAILRGRRRRVGGVAAAAIGAAGPLAALATLHALELRLPESAPGAWLLWFGLAPCAALAGVFAAVALVTALPERRSAVSK